jgi:hypothetical protein
MKILEKFKKFKDKKGKVKLKRISNGTFKYVPKTRQRSPEPIKDIIIK